MGEQKRTFLQHQQAKLAGVKAKKADILSISPSSEQLEELWVVCGFISRKWNYTIVPSPYSHQ